jgi:DNA-binding MltR family transcriptional regulator
MTRLTPETKSILDDPKRLKDALAFADVFLRDVAGDNDRAAGITAATMVDSGLRTLIESRLLALSNTRKDDLFGESGPLGSFWARIELSFALGLANAEACADLHLIRRIRNRFAHHFEMSTFEHPKISELSNQLAIPNKIPREKFDIQRFSKFRSSYTLSTMFYSMEMEDLAKINIRLTEVP